MPSVHLAGKDHYAVDWASIDDALDRGAPIHWCHSPAWKWFGGSAFYLMHAGVIRCPVCGEARPGRETCDYCLRTGGQTRLPRTRPTAPLRRKVAKFRPKAA